MSLPRRDVEHIFEKLRSGLVPERGLDTFATGIEKDRAEIGRQLDLAASGEGLVKFLRGGYGCGKTFMSRLATADAQERGFVTSFVVVSDNDLHFHRFDDVYRKVVSELSTPTAPRGALGDILDRWIGAVEDMVIDGGADEEADGFDDLVRQRISEELHSHTQGQVPEDFVRVVQAVFDLKQEGDLANAGALLSWLSGSPNVAAAAKRRAGIKGDIGSRTAMDYLHGIRVMVRMAGYRGLLVVIDEAETILRMRKDVRAKSMNGIRQISDMSGRYPGLLWLFTGTPDFFDSRRGVAGLEPLHDRIKFMQEGGFASRRQPQLLLKPFDHERLFEVAIKLRDLYRADHPDRVRTRVTDEYIRLLVREVSAGFGGDVGVVPRQFLRRLTLALSTVDENEDYHPLRYLEDHGVQVDPDEVALATGKLPNEDDDDSMMGEEAVW